MNKPTSFPHALRGRICAQTQTPEQMFGELNKHLNGFISRYDERFQNLASAMEAIQSRVNGGIVPPNGLLAAGIGEEVRAQFRAAMRGDVQAAMEIGSGPDGGYAVPTQIDAQIMAILRQTSPLRRLAYSVTLGTGAGSWRKIVNRIGGGSRWAHELEERKETSTPQLGAVEIAPEEIYAIPEVTNHVLDDSSFNLEAFLRDDVTAECALGESEAFIVGDGVKKPLGFLTRPTSDDPDAERPFGTYQHIVTGEAGAFAEDADGGFQSNLIDLIFTLRAPYRVGDGVGFLMNSLTASRVMKFRDADGRLIWTNGLTAADPNRLLGYPVEIDENMPDIAADALPIAFGNWRRGYAIVDRPGMKLIRDNVTRKGWTKFYFSKRVGGAPLDTNAVKFLKFSAA